MRVRERNAQRTRKDRRFRRRLTLSHDGKTFLDRWGLVHERIGGFYVHRIAGPDPGLDLHDHPWPFLTWILWGGYSEEVASADSAVTCAQIAERWPDTCTPGVPRSWRRWSIHRMPLTVAHRITSAKPHTWTIVLRGPTRRVWGFYPPTGRVEWTGYDYATRRPNKVTSNRPKEVMS